MGKEFGVKSGQLKAAAKEFGEVSRMLKACTADMRSVRNRLDGNSLAYYRGVISSLAEAGDTYAKHTGNLKTSLEDIAQKYEETEQRILGGMDTGQNGTLDWLWSQGKDSLEGFAWGKVGDTGPAGKIIAGIADIAGIVKGGLSGESEINAAWAGVIGSGINSGKDLIDDAAQKAADLAEMAGSKADDLAAGIAAGNTDDFVRSSAATWREVGENAVKKATALSKAGKILGMVGNVITVATTGVDKYNKYKDKGVEGLDIGVLTDGRFVVETAAESGLTIAAGAAIGTVGGPVGIAIGAAVGAADIGCRWATREFLGEEYEAGLIELVAGKFIAQNAVLGIVWGKTISFAGDALASTDNKILTGIGNAVSGVGDKLAGWHSSLLQGTTAGNEAKLAGTAMEVVGDSLASSDIGFLSEIGNAVANTGDAVVGWTVEPEI